VTPVRSSGRGNANRIAARYGKAAFDAVGPLLLIGRAEVGPGLIQAVAATRRQPSEENGSKPAGVGTVDTATDIVSATGSSQNSEARTREVTDLLVQFAADGDLMERARREEARYWAAHQRPISAETLRKNLRIGPARSRMLVSIIRQGGPPANIPTRPSTCQSESS
jgi:hypothetical protein